MLKTNQVPDKKPERFDNLNDLRVSHIVIYTDFSETSANALRYGGALAQSRGAELVLAHFFEIPFNYSAEGLSTVAIQDAIESEEELLRRELNTARNLFPGLQVEATMFVGQFTDFLKELKNSFQPQMIVIGAAGTYSELWQWGNDWLDAMLISQYPVLIIPRSLYYQPYKNISFACDYKKHCLPGQVKIIKDLLGKTGANLHIVHVAKEVAQVKEKETVLSTQEALEGLNPEYHFIENKRVITGLSDFIKQKQSDLLIVIPRRHDLWYHLFNKSYSRQLALLNYLPVLAIHEDDGTS